MNLLASIRDLQQLEHYASDEIHRVVIDGISDNKASLVELEKYGSINTTDTTTN